MAADPLKIFICYAREDREALDGHARQENVVVPVILYDCLWDAHHELSRLQALPVGMVRGRPAY